MNASTLTRTAVFPLERDRNRDTYTLTMTPEVMVEVVKLIRAGASQREGLEVAFTVIQAGAEFPLSDAEII